MKVTRISVRVEIEDDDGETSVHEADGMPARGVVASVVPHYQRTYSRRTGGFSVSEVVEVGIRLEALLLPTPGETLFRATYSDPSTPTSHSNVILAMTEAPRES